VGIGGSAGQNDPLARDLRILIVDDSGNDAELLLDHLTRNGYTPKHRRVDNARDLGSALRQETWDLIVADHTMPNFSGSAALDLVKKSGLAIPFIFVSGTIKPEEATRAMKVGAAATILKGNLGALVPEIDRALRPLSPVVASPSFTPEQLERAVETKMLTLLGVKKALEEELVCLKVRAEERDQLISRLMCGSRDPADRDSAPRRPVVLLVDDREENLLALEALLSDLGADLRKASSGQEALACLLECEPALILLDIRMPGMDGLEVARLIKARSKSRFIPILFLSAHEDSGEQILDVCRTGAFDYLPKPFPPELLHSKVEVFLELWRRTEELKTQMLRCELMNKELETFTHTMAHDLRAPLRAMAKFSEALAVDYAPRLDAAGKEYAKRIQSAATSMTQLIGDLLGYAHLNRLEVPLEEVDLTTQADQVLAELSEGIRESGASVTVERPLGVAIANPTTLRQALQNLVTNALKFVAPGVKPAVTLRSERREGRIRLWVEDNGIGVTPDDHEKIFDVFVRLHGPEEYPGTGMGLAIVRKAMERMNGKAGIESGPRAGSRFWLELRAP
jgi:two-component system sensor histidine kinase/response regulator